MARGVFVVAVLAAALLLPIPAAAGIVFTSGATIQLTPGESVAVGVCNTGTSGSASLDLRFSDFAFMNGGQPVAARDVLKLVTGPTTIEAGKCDELRLTAQGVLDPGSYSGQVVLEGQTSLVARAVTVTVPGSARAPLPSIAAAQLQARRSTFRLPWHVRRGPAYLIGVKVVPFGPYLPADQVTRLQRLTSGTELAILQNGSRRAQLVADGPGVEGQDGYVRVPVRLVGARRAGTYKGTVAVDAVKLDVSVSVGDSLGVAVAWVTAVILATVLLLLLVQRLWPSTRVWAFRRVLPLRYWWAQRRLGDHLAGTTIAAPPVAYESVKKYAREIRDAYKAGARRAVADAAGADPFSAARKLMRAATDDVTALRSHAGLEQALRDLSQALDGYDGLAIPLVGAAEALFVPDPLNVGDALQRGADARTFAAVLGGLPTLRSRIGRYEAWADVIAPGLTPARDQSRFWSARAKLAEVDYVLSSSEDAKAFEHEALSVELDEVEKALLEYADLAFVPPIPNAGFGEPLLLLAEASRIGVAGSRIVSSARKVFAVSPAAPLAAGAAVFGFAAVGLAAAVATIALSLGATLATVGSTYSDTFGSLNDYLTIAGISGAASTAAKAVVDSLAKLRAPL